MKHVSHHASVMQGFELLHTVFSCLLFLPEQVRQSLPSCRAATSSSPTEVWCLHITALLQIRLSSPFASLNTPFGPPESTKCFDYTLSSGLLCQSLCCAGLLCPPHRNPAGVCLGVQFGKKVKRIVPVLPVK